MARKLSNLKKAKYKKARKEGKSIRESLLEAGYAESTSIGKNGSLTFVEVCEKELTEEFKLSDITPEFVINNLLEDRKLAKNKKDYSTVTRVDELLGKYLSLWKDVKEIGLTKKTEEDLETLGKYRTRYKESVEVSDN